MSRPIINGKVGDKLAYFLLDTGTNLALIDINQKEDFGLEIGDVFPGTIIGVGGNMGNVNYCKTPITIGTKELKDFILADLTSIKNSILRETGFGILGIISYKQMQFLGIIINPQKNEVYGI